MLKAQVFISCGQFIKEEKKIGTAIVKYFEKRGFEPYFAEEVHSPLGLTQNIYNNLRTSEYFVCINFNRMDSDFGSLFVQQELAIASFQTLPLIAFHKPGIKLKGVSKYLQVNSIEFNSINDIVKNLDKKTKNWDPKSKNQFSLAFGREDLNVEIYNQNRVFSNWYHIMVVNLSSLLNARNCYCFIESIYDLVAKKEIFGKNEYKNELVWAGTGVVNVNIPSEAKKDIDAIYTIQGSGSWLFQEINTSTIYKYPQLTNGKYKIIYTLHSDNFPSTKIELKMELANDRLKLIRARQLF